ncbi:MAG: family 78 glycoside hydrolase catalytic domain [Kiritimatiellaeota bacterium]|nr:family 78 glycoside hydrolase catalytic domain [Kiritimatiellota bacterium]
MGLVKPEDWQGAKWIGLDARLPKSEHTRLAARYLRREFVIGKPITSATAYFCGLGESELYLNGKNVGDRERDPGMTMFSKRCLYVTFDAKDLLKEGSNAIGAIVGNGRFFAPRVARPARYKNFGAPRMLLSIRICFADGSLQDIVSDESWRATDQGPIRANNEYDGEEYDARLEMPGWDRVGFNDSGWKQAELLSAPGGRLQSRMYEPMRITERFKPVKITNPDPGVYIVHFAKGFYGTIQIKMSGAAGDKVVMRSTFDLLANGRLNIANNRSAKTSDIYILKGGGEETWRPRFRGQGTRYVEVTGFPGTPQLADFEGLFMHDDIEETGKFECSDALINQLDRLMRYDQLGQKQSHPKELERDERMGWLGGSGTYAVDEFVHLNSAAFYAKWMGDARLEQNADGSISDVCPAYWNFRSKSLVWPADVILIPLALYDYFGDRRVLEENYETMKKWVVYTLALLKPDDTVDHDKYGDHCPVVPTPLPLIGTAYMHNNCKQLSRVARLLGKDQDAKHFADIAAKVKTAYNKRFFDPKSNTYEGKTQCAYVLSLAFDLVPEDRRQAVIENLVNDIMVVRQRHVSVGLVGMAWIMRTLNDRGRADVAYALVTRTDKPSWGYMLAKDASGMWEKWDHDTAGPGMNGQGFLMLTGDLNAWFYQGLAGINPDPQQPGFKHIILKPQPVGDLKYVRASYQSMHGLIVSDWKIAQGKFLWNVTVPANATATLHVPARNADSVTESGKPAGQAEGLKFLRMERGAAAYEVGSGTYQFQATLPETIR